MWHSNIQTGLMTICYKTEVTLSLYDVCNIVTHSQTKFLEIRRWNPLQTQTKKNLLLPLSFTVTAKITFCFVRESTSDKESNYDNYQYQHRQADQKKINK